MDKTKEMKGKAYHRWTVLCRDGNAKTQKQAMWKCLCECGTIKTVSGYALRSGKSKSCGCLKIELFKERSITHGMTGTRIYRAWKNMRARCYNKNNQDYARYGGRGIKVCNRWKKSENFIRDMIATHKIDLELDRIDNNGNYCPQNCRWTTRTIQNNNTSRNIYIEFKKKTLTVTQWSRKTGIHINTLWDRLYKHKWSVEDALTKPITS